MKRYPFVIGATAVGLAGVLSFHTRATHGLSGSSLAVTARGTTAPSKSSPTTTQPPAAGGTGAGTGGSSAASSATGSAEQYGYGVLSVKVTVSGSRITDVQTVELQTAESYSQQIAQQAIPYLRQQVLSLQSSRIDGISGATYTSEAYALSVQSALDKLHFS